MTQNEVIGMVMGALVVIVGLFVAVGKPVIKLNTTLTEIVTNQQHLIKNVDDHKEENKKEFEELWNCEERQDGEIRDHEGRLIKLETKRVRKKAAE